MNSSELFHHGIKGQKWGVRRFQNDDGSLTEEGLKRYRNYKDAVNNWNKSRMKHWTPRRELKNKKLESKIDQAREPLKEVTDKLDVDAYRKSVMKGDYDDFVNLRKMRAKANDELKNDKKLLEQTAEKRLDDIKELYKRFSKNSKFDNDRYKEYEAMTDEDRKEWVKEEVEDFFSSIDAHDNLLDTHIENNPEYKKIQDKGYALYQKYKNVPYSEVLLYHD